MSDFMKWLYANYITPQINAASQEDYEAYFSLMENTLEKKVPASTQQVY